MNKPILFLALLLAAACAPFAQAADSVSDVAEVQAEFAMPVYRNPSQAELTVVGVGVRPEFLHK